MYPSNTSWIAISSVLDRRWSTCSPSSMDGNTFRNSHRFHPFLFSNFPLFCEETHLTWRRNHGKNQANSHLHGDEHHGPAALDWHQSGGFVARQWFLRQMTAKTCKHHQSADRCWWMRSDYVWFDWKEHVELKKLREHGGWTWLNSQNRTKWSLPVVPPTMSIRGGEFTGRNEFTGRSQWESCGMKRPVICDMIHGYSWLNTVFNHEKWRLSDDFINKDGVTTGIIWGSFGWIVTTSDVTRMGVKKG